MDFGAATAYATASGSVRENIGQMPLTNPMVYPDTVADCEVGSEHDKIGVDSVFVPLPWKRLRAVRREGACCNCGDWGSC